MSRVYGVSQPWISRLVARYRPKVRPHTSPGRLPSSTIDLIIELREKLCSKGLDNGRHGFWSRCRSCNAVPDYALISIRALHLLRVG